MGLSGNETPRAGKIVLWIMNTSPVARGPSKKPETDGPRAGSRNQLARPHCIRREQGDYPSTFRQDGCLKEEIKEAHSSIEDSMRSANYKKAPLGIGTLTAVFDCHSDLQQHSY